MSGHFRLRGQSIVLSGLTEDIFAAEPSVVSQAEEDGWGVQRFEEALSTGEQIRRALGDTEGRLRADASLRPYHGDDRRFYYLGLFLVKGETILELARAMRLTPFTGISICVAHSTERPGPAWGYDGIRTVLAPASEPIDPSVYLRESSD